MWKRRRFYSFFYPQKTNMPTHVGCGLTCWHWLPCKLPCNWQQNSRNFASFSWISSFYKTRLVKARFKFYTFGFSCTKKLSSKSWATKVEQKKLSSKSWAAKIEQQKLSSKSGAEKVEQPKLFGEQCTRVPQLVTHQLAVP